MIGSYADATMIIADATGLGIGIAVFFIVWVFIALGALVLMIFVLIDILKRPEWQWKVAHQEKVLWILLVLLVNFLAIPSLIYWFNIRKKLQTVEEAAAKGLYGPGHMTYSGWEPVPVLPAMAPAGWYPDATGQAPLRWWDGMQWTDHTSTDSPPSPVVPPPQAP